MAEAERATSRCGSVLNPAQSVAEQAELELLRMPRT